MLNAYKDIKKIIRMYCIATALLLIISFAFHGILPHEHPEEAFGSLQAALHSNDRKLLALLLLSVIVFTAEQFIKKMLLALRILSTPLSPFRLNMFAKIRHPMLRALRGGILHPKLCG